ncbi:RNA polymerase sigma factor (sigma-70 family) [Melghiribacillus thermohalophilus]|uniref:RNA polymerase sigma factor (Sigma-70 family) n=1 Tax=Melghiribacillus thermohalophilus TaxID=1324956 RepID=A0A4R3NCG3_9BACI|nr:sigma-70 family RNA polymerase sigma factor [Melghiribacillus thermohalophilus]TCT26451.1 RNA polymerase sigma factor (sigma-70 family) [Melghiribacillus thermohalophilus]
MKGLSYEEVVEEYGNMIHHVIHRLGIHDSYQEFYHEGLLALWEACRKYDESKGDFPGFAYFTIRSRIIDAIRKKRRYTERERPAEDFPVIGCIHEEMEELDPYFWRMVRGQLTDKQWIYVNEHIVEGKSIKEIARNHNTTIDAVKNWGKLARKKLKNCEFLKQRY